MEKSDRETRDFMNVDSFSQLPFIRPAPIKEKPIFKLFGKEFGGDSTANDEPEHCENNSTTQEEGKDNDNNNNGDSSSSRKFECHYCCRNFPTSQALGGHQNAHKRERQNAKRAHLRSAMVNGGLVEPHVYGVMNYSPPSAMASHHHHHSWSNRSNYSYASDSRLYGSYNYTQAPINGSPLALWRMRIPSSFQSSACPSIYDEKPSKPNSQLGLGCELKPTMQEGHVSLDLHL